MKITKNVELRPFTVPNYVIQASTPRPREDGFVESPKFHIGELDVETLDQLCAQFRKDVFAKAEKYRQETSGSAVE